MMKMHKYEKIWLYFGGASLLFFLIVVWVSAFYMGNKPPSWAVTLDPEKVEQHESFKEPWLVEVGDNEYQLNIVSSGFDYDVGNDDKGVEIPKDANVHISAATNDVIHGYEIAGTSANMMLEPRYINAVTNTFKKAGEYTLE